MKFEPTAGRIPQLVTWAKNHELAVLTGAGVSGTVEANLGWGPGAGSDDKKK